MFYVQSFAIKKAYVRIISYLCTCLACLVPLPMDQLNPRSIQMCTELFDL